MQLKQLINMKNVKKLLTTIVLFASTCGYIAAQSKVGSINVIQDASIEKFLNAYKSENEKVKKISGFRVQLFSGASRDLSKETKSKFLSLFPEINAYEIYTQPNFKLRVGDCRTKLEAVKLQKEIAVEFPHTFIVQDEIEWPKLD